MKFISNLFVLIFVLFSVTAETKSARVPLKNIVIFKDLALNLDQLKLIDKKMVKPVNIAWDVDKEQSIWQQPKWKEDDFFPVGINGLAVNYLRITDKMEKDAITGYIAELWDKKKENKIWSYTPSVCLSTGNYTKFILDNNLLYIGIFSPISSGSDFVCVDFTTGKEVWHADVKQLLVDHSKYKNEIFLVKIGEKLVFAGDEAGGYYLQVFDAKTGKKIFSEMRK